MNEMNYYLEPVKGIKKGGRLIVKGPNIMLGYLLHDKPGEIQPPSTKKGPGWYDTGDIAEVDDDGFITILGRAKRFATTTEPGQRAKQGTVKRLSGVRRN